MPSIYDDIGGSSAVAVAVDDLYERIIADHELAPYFTRVDMRRQKTHMRAFMAAALGGPDIYRGRDMAAAHAHLRITGRAFDRVAGHLVATLRGLGLAAAHVDAIVARVAPLREQIVNDGEDRLAA
jgi:hemoglobin